MSSGEGTSAGLNSASHAATTAATAAARSRHDAEAARWRSPSNPPSSRRNSILIVSPSVDNTARSGDVPSAASGSSRRSLSATSAGSGQVAVPETVTMGCASSSTSRVWAITTTPWVAEPSASELLLPRLRVSAHRPARSTGEAQGRPRRAQRIGPSRKVKVFSPDKHWQPRSHNDRDKNFPSGHADWVGPGPGLQFPRRRCFRIRRHHRIWRQTGHWRHIGRWRRPGFGRHRQQRWNSQRRLNW